MSKLDELINELCPNGVEYNKLKDCAEMKRGSSATKNTLKEGDIPVISGGREPSFYCDESNREGETITIAGSGAGAGYVQYWNSPIFVNDAFSIKGNEILNTRYLYHCLLNMQGEIYASKKGVGVPHVHISSIANFKIPLPPLPIQEEIVRILDNFAELTAELTTELTAELTARKKQYEYFENKLLFDNDSELLRLSDICIVNQGLQIPISQRFQEPGEKRYRYITVQFLKNKENEQFYIENPDSNVICSEDDILVTRTGSTGVIVSGVKGCFHNNFFKVTCNELVNQKYMFYLLKSNVMYKRMLAAASGGTVPDLPHKKFYNLSVPIPCIKKQLQIVSILQRFNTLCNDISQGLSTEIKARQQQYEYYRDKLLTFPKADVEE